MWGGFSWGSFMGSNVSRERISLGGGGVSYEGNFMGGEFHGRRISLRGDFTRKVFVREDFSWSRSRIWPVCECKRDFGYRHSTRHKLVSWTVSIYEL